MSNSHGSTSNVSNKTLNTNSRKAPRYVRNRVPGMSITFETGKIKTKCYEDVDIAVKQKKFDAWKAHAKKFSWDLFAIPGTLKGGMKGNASSNFHKYAPIIVKENGWKNFHVMTLWSLLPEEYKNEWQAAAELGRAQETSKSATSCAKVPKFEEMDHFQDGKCAYFSFEATPALSAPPVVDTGNDDEPGSSKDAFSASRDSTCDIANGNFQPTPLDYTLDLEKDLMPAGQSISPELNLKSIHKFDFGPISEFGACNIIPSRDSHLPLSPEDLSYDEPRPTKRRRKNPKETTQSSAYNPKPEALAPPNGLDSFFGPQVPPLSTTPRPQGLMTQEGFNTSPNNPLTISTESKDKLCNGQGASSSMSPRPPAEASASRLSHASTSADVRGQEFGEQYNIGLSLFWEDTSTIGSSQWDGDNALTLDSDTIADILSTIDQDLTAGYLTDSSLKTRESWNYEFPGGFGF